MMIEIFTMSDPVQGASEINAGFPTKIDGIEELTNGIRARLIQLLVC